MSFGQFGGEYIATGADSSAPAGYVIVAVLSLDDATTITNPESGYPQVAGIPIPAGVTVYGRWPSDTLTIGGAGGKAIAYYAPNN